MNSSLDNVAIGKTSNQIAMFRIFFLRNDLTQKSSTNHYTEQNPSEIKEPLRRSAGMPFVFFRAMAS
jgi:hypothetical protein